MINRVIQSDSTAQLHLVGTMDYIKDNTLESDYGKIKIKQATRQGYIECESGGVANLSYPDSKLRRGRVIDNGKTSPTIQTENEIYKIERVGQISNDDSQYETVSDEKGLSTLLNAGTQGYANSCIHTKYRIRKLTPLECFRLMNFDDKDFYLAESVNSNTQLYKQAGNSIVVAVLSALFSQLNIQGIISWNKMTEEGRKQITAVNKCINPNLEKDLL